MEQLPHETGGGAPGEATADERNLAMLMHLLTLISLLLGGWFVHILVPLVAWLWKRETSPFVAAHSREQLNFEISLTLYAIVAGLLALLTLGLGLGWSLAPARERAPPGPQALASFPRDLGDWAAAGGDAGDGGRWQGTPAPLTPALERILGADDYLSALYVDPAENPAAAAPVDLFLSFYARQTAGNAVHSPEVCLPGAGWEIATLAVVPVEVAGERFAVNRAVIRKGAERQLVWYWFEGRGRRLTGDFAVKGWTLLDSLRDGRSDGGLVRLITPIRPAPAGGSEDGGGEAAAPAGGKSEDGGEAAADARLARFLAASLREIPRFIPN
jgi:EpsI family protein